MRIAVLNAGRVGLAVCCGLPGRRLRAEYNDAEDARLDLGRAHQGLVVAPVSLRVALAIVVGCALLAGAAILAILYQVKCERGYAVLDGELVPTCEAIGLGK